MAFAAGVARYVLIGFSIVFFLITTHSGLQDSDGAAQSSFAHDRYDAGRRQALFVAQARTTTATSAAPAASLCAGHVQPLGGASPLPDLMEVRVSNDARATVARRGLKEAWSKCASRWTRTGYKA